MVRDDLQEFSVIQECGVAGAVLVVGRASISPKINKSIPGVEVVILGPYPYVWNRGCNAITELNNAMNLGGGR